jgi:hypothetical protein
MCRFLSLFAVCALLSACDSDTDPVEQIGLTVQNRTSDSVFVYPLALTPLTDLYFPTPSDVLPPTQIDSSRFSVDDLHTLKFNVLAPGTSITFFPNTIVDYAPQYTIAILVSRVRRGYQIPAGAVSLSPKDIRATGPRVVLQNGRFFPSVAR